MRVAELCAGYGGLYLAMRQAGWPVELAWWAETDPDAASVMSAHHDSPNVGDITAADWSAVEPVDVLAAGWPCQPFSNAGRRKGYDDDRAIWPAVLDAVRVVRPRLFVGENVSAHLARGFGRVVRELAEIGYVGSWMCVRASDVGAPHRRDRLFIVAHPDGEFLWPQPESVAECRGAAVTGGHSSESGVMLLPTPTRRDGIGGPGHQGRDGGLNLRTAVALLPTPSARDSGRGSGWGDQPGRPLSETVHRLLPTPCARLGDERGMPGVDVAASRFAAGKRDLDDAIALLPTPRASDDADKSGPNQRGSSGDLALASAAALVDAGGWDVYGPAIRRWERVVGREAPEPTVEPTRRGANRQLSAHFVEWLMGLPVGWVTDVVPRKPALRVLGNGVVPLQGAAALATLGGVA